ncbi:MAG: DUF3108 domain-containing protein [Flavobacteriales bacterium]|nr:DUF3108 domain-containing protein [Flavobacteriales bacterium]
MKNLRTTKIGLGIVAAILVLSFSAYQQNDLPTINTDGNSKLRTVDHKAFKDGEKLEFRLHYGFVNAGTAKIEVNKLDKKIANREIYHIVGTGKTVGAFDWVFKVRDRYETFLDVEGVFPWMFVRDINEGGYKKKQKYQFSQTKKMVETHKGEVYETPEGIQDMLSSFFYARTLDYSKAKKGDVFTIWTFVDEEVWPLKIRYMGEDKVKVGKTYYNALKFHPVTQKGRIFDKEEDVSFWVSNDGNKIPLMIEAKILIGAVKAELTNAEGLAHPLSIAKK